MSGSKILVNLKKISQKYNEESDKRYFLEVDLQYTKNLHELRNDLQVLRERMKIEKVEKLIANLHDKTEYIIHISNLKENRGLVLKKLD